MPYVLDVVAHPRLYYQVRVADVVSTSVMLVRCRLRVEELLQTLTISTHNAFLILRGLCKARQGQSSHSFERGRLRLPTRKPVGLRSRAKRLVIATAAAAPAAAGRRRSTLLRDCGWSIGRRRVTAAMMSGRHVLVRANHLSRLCFATRSLRGSFRCGVSRPAWTAAAISYFGGGGSSSVAAAL
jgi:hypothetical protein